MTKHIFYRREMRMREKKIRSLEKQKDTDERGVRRCGTCQKRSLSGRCRVLIENIGRDQDCWAWTDDPDWEQKVRQAVKKYGKMGGDIIDDD